MISNHNVKAWFDTFFRTYDWQDDVVATFFDGYNTYNDYVKYGDMFKRAYAVDISYTSVGRQLKA